MKKNPPFHQGIFKYALMALYVSGLLAEIINILHADPVPIYRKSIETAQPDADVTNISGSSSGYYYPPQKLYDSHVTAAIPVGKVSAPVLARTPQFNLKKTDVSIAATTDTSAYGETRGKAQEQKIKNSYAENLLIYAIVVFIATGLILAIIGTVLGLERKIIIYNGTSDLIVSFLIPVVFILAIPNFGLVGWLLKFLCFFLILYSLRETFDANQKISRLFFAFPAKFFLVGLISICALMCLGGFRAAFDAYEKKKHKDAVKLLAVGVAGAAGFYHLNKLIHKLLKEK